MAIGASPDQTVRLVVSRYLRLAVLGLTLGAAGSVLALRLVATYLIGVTAHDPLTIGVVWTVMLVTVAIAAWLPARGLYRAKLTSELA